MAGVVGRQDIRRRLRAGPGPNWTVFEPNEIDVRNVWPIDPEDPNFIAAMEIVGLGLEEE